MTYNSGLYVLETLESIKSQSCLDFELIITDDCSTDNTVKLCRNWIDRYSNLPFKVTLLTADVNKGIPANCNKAIMKAEGKWIKIIAGDDLLNSDCLAHLKNAKLTEDQKIIVGRFIPFYLEIGKKIYCSRLPTEKQLKFFNFDAAKQHRLLLTESFNFSPAAFIRRDLFQEGLFNERYRFLEDLPFWIRSSKNGHKLYLLNEDVMYYRTQHESMVFSGETFYNKRFMDGLYTFREEVVYREVPKTNIIFYQAELMERINYWVITNIFKNKKTKLSVLVSKVLLFPTIKRLKNIIK